MDRTPGPGSLIETASNPWARAMEMKEPFRSERNRSRWLFKKKNKMDEKDDI